MRFLLLLALVFGLLLFGSVLVIDDGFGIYLKRSPGLGSIYVNAGPGPHNLERLLFQINKRYRLLVLGYSESRGLKLFEPVPALP